MHILVMPSWYSNSLQPNSGIFFRNHVRCLEELGHTVGVAFYEGRILRSMSPTAWAENHFQISDRVEDDIQTVRMRGWNPLSQTAAGARMMGKFYERTALAYIRAHGRPDVVHVQSGMWAGLGASRLNRRLGIPFALTEHSNFVPSESQSRARNHLYTDVVKHASSVSAVSTWLADDLRRKTGINEFTITPNCVDLSFWQPKGTPPASGGPKFIAIGHLVQLKGFDNLLRAFAIVRESASTASLTIVGAGVELARLMSIVTARSLENSVSILGEVPHDELRDLLWNADCYVCSSRVETFGVAVLEALASRVPVVSTECGGPEDFLSLPSGWMVPVDDPQAMAKGMLAQIRGDRQKQNEHADLVASKYSFRAVGQLLEQFLSTAANSTQGR